MLLRGAGRLLHVVVHDGRRRCVRERVHLGRVHDGREGQRRRRRWMVVVACRQERVAPAGLTGSRPRRTAVALDVQVVAAAARAHARVQVLVPVQATAAAAAATAQPRTRVVVEAAPMQPLLLPACLMR